MGGNPLLRNDPSGLDLFTTSAAILSGGAIIIRGGALINGGPLAGAVIVQTGYDGFCLARDVSNSDDRTKEQDILENACRNVIPGACNRLQVDAQGANEARGENVRQGGGIASGADSGLKPIDLLNVFRGGK